MTDATRKLLCALTDGGFVSGSMLARDLGITRAAIWKQIEALRDLGVPIDAVAGSGYRLRWPLELLDAKRIEADLASPLAESLTALDVFWQIDSTNSELLRRAAQGATGTHVCIGEMQTHGRGRLGRVWQSPLGGNLYCSMLHRFTQGMGTLAGLSLVVGVAVVEALQDCGVSDVGLKWPNDVLARQRKLAGILVELGGDFLGPCFAVIGVGINVSLQPDTRERIGQPSIDLAELMPDILPSRNRLAACLITRLAAALARFSDLGFAAFADAYAALDLLRGGEVRVHSASSTRDGVAAGVNPSGALIVQHGAHKVHYDSAEISIRAVPGSVVHSGATH